MEKEGLVLNVGEGFNKVDFHRKRNAINVLGISLKADDYIMSDKREENMPFYKRI